LPPWAARSKFTRHARIQIRLNPAFIAGVRPRAQAHNGRIVSFEEAAMPTDRVRTVMAILFLASLFLGSLAGCGGGGGHPGNPNSPVKLQSATTGSLAVTIASLPAGLAGAVRVTGPANYVADLTSSVTLGGIAPGDYTITALPVAVGAAAWVPFPPTQTVTVTAGVTATASVVYGPG
jgi:hypothetical protein